MPNADILATIESLTVWQKLISDLSSLLTGYRKRGGGRHRMIPDFMIAAQSMEHSAGWATADRDFIRAHFPRLKILQP